VDFALSELGYFHGVVRKPVSTDLAYAYLVEHARWFTTEPGQELLAAVTL
jgi:hypothetical protein